VQKRVILAVEDQVSDVLKPADVSSGALLDRAGQRLMAS
jgi:hypothetical protein